MNVVEGRKSTKIHGLGIKGQYILEGKIAALVKDNSRLIDEKANELTRNTYLETQIRRLTP